MEKLFMTMLKNMGFDAEAVQAKVYEAVNDIQSMKASQDRCEAMLNVLVARGEMIPVRDAGLYQAYIFKSDADERDAVRYPAATDAMKRNAEAEQWRNPLIPSVPIVAGHPEKLEGVWANKTEETDR